MVGSKSVWLAVVHDAKLKRKLTCVKAKKANVQTRRIHSDDDFCQGRVAPPAYVPKQVLDLRAVTVTDHRDRNRFEISQVLGSMKLVVSLAGALDFFAKPTAGCYFDCVFGRPASCQYAKAQAKRGWPGF